jgi:uncharacterized protein (TIGR03089 family)
MPTPADLLRTALTDDPARPFLTFYDDATGERVELSVATFANWVAKTGGLLQDHVAMLPGQRLGVALPVHWQAAVYLQACWATGVVAHPTDRVDAGDDVVVTTPERVAEAEGSEVIALSLRPALQAARGPADLPWSAIDGETEVLGQPDTYAPAHFLPAGAPGLLLDGRTWTREELGDVACTEAERLAVGPGARVLTALPLETLPGIAAALLVPLAVRGSAVLCRNLDADRLAARISTERVDVVME